MSIIACDMLLLVSQVKKKRDEELELHYPKVYEVRNMIEYPHLSQAGYEDMADSFKKYGILE